MATEREPISDRVVECVDLVSDDEDVIGDHSAEKNVSNEDIPSNSVVDFKMEICRKLIEERVQQRFQEADCEGYSLMDRLNETITDFGLCNSKINELEESFGSLRNKVDKLRKEQSFDDILKLTEDGFLEVRGPFQRIVPICALTNKAIREASYMSNKVFETTGSSKGHWVTEDLIAEFPSSKSPDLIDIHYNIYQQHSEQVSIERPPVKEGDTVYANAGPEFSNHWKLGTIESVDEERDKYTVTFYKIPSLIVCRKKLAYDSIPPVLLTIGLRVAAHFKKEPWIPKIEAPDVLSGMIAEIPKSSNNNRYLIFFDNGGVSYVPYEDVYLVVEDSCPWDEIEDKYLKRFTEKYCRDFPERAMIKFQIGEKMKVHRDKKWEHSVVTDIDCSLVKVCYNTDGQTEWLYRGSIRLLAIRLKFRELFKEPVTSSQDVMNSSISSKPQRNKISKTTTVKGEKTPSRPFIQYTLEEVDEANVSRHVRDQKAKKGTTRANMHSPRPMRKVAKMKKKLLSLFEVPALFLEKSKRDIVYTLHDCYINCIHGVDENIQNLKNLNPYSYPVFANWKRNFERRFEDDNDTRKGRRARVVYTSPCGRQLYDIEDVVKYLKATRSKLTIDLFTFEQIHVYREPTNHYLSVFYYNKDLSAGKEFHAISVVNEIDDEKPDEFVYSTKRIAGPGVELPLDMDFLPCCECIDNCESEVRCRCRKYTCEAAENENVGYEHRRLEGYVMTGVFECNAMCACNEKCPNKLVQFGIRVQLQLFKTQRKGWGVRVLHDVPSGAFICTYAAEVISDTDVLEDDKYFADLDLINVCEGMKEGYESSAELSSEDESDDSSRLQSKRKRSDSSPIRRNSSDNNVFHIRNYYNEDFSYILDAQKYGNIGRFLNHSCDPNCFVQNVFVDTHDLRFPWVAIFAARNIRALEEITWDYNYKVGSVEGKKLFCYCGSANCRGRLL